MRETEMVYDNHTLDGFYGSLGSYLEPVSWGTIYPRGGGLGQLDPGSLALEINTAIATAREFWESILKIFGVGAGRMEADVITPLQTKITNTVLVPAVDMGTHPEQHTCQEMLQMNSLITHAHDEFKSLLVNTQWVDGRAAQQAMVWLEGPLPASVQNPSWFHQVQVDFAGEVADKGCMGGIPIPGAGTSISWTTAALIGAGAYLLTRARK